MIGVGVCGGGDEELIGSAYNVSATFFFITLLLELKWKTLSSMHRYFCVQGQKKVCWVCAAKNAKKNKSLNFALLCVSDR